MKDETTFAFAGIWEMWNPPTGEEIESAALITTAANSLMEHIHPRMPVIIPPESYDAWLDETAALPDVLAMLKPYDSDRLKAYRVDRAVGNVKNDGPQLMEPLSPAGPTPYSGQ